MNHCYLEDAGLYRATLEAMMYGTPSQETEEKGFNDSVLERKSKKVNDLVKKFEKNMKLEESTVDIEEDKESRVAEEAKPRSTIPSMEQFVQGILRSSSPIPQEDDVVAEASETPAQLQETPILPYHPVRRDLDFGILDSDTTKSIRRASKSEGRAKIAKAKAASTPKSQATAHKESPDSAYFSAGSSAVTTPAGPSTSDETKEEELDIYLKLARAKLHEQIKKYSTWKAENLRSIAIKVCSMRLSALQKSARDCSTAQMMVQIYEQCLSGPVTKELDTIVVSIFHLLDEQVHVERISVLEEYVVMKYCKKMVQ